MPTKKSTTTHILEKIVVNIGVGKLRNLQQFDDKILPEIEKEIALITGQKPERRGAKQSIAGFKTREGDVVGLQITLRRKKMDDFLNKIVRIVLPRVKDFRGIPRNGFDGRGNYNFGLTEQLIFPEVDYDSIMQIHGMNITVVTSATADKDAFKLLEMIGMPFAKGRE